MTTDALKVNGKHIVLCFDGTGDWVATDVTNVAKIYQALDKTEVLSFYDGGVGTISFPGEQDPFARGLMRLIDGALAKQLGDKTLNGYRFLIQHYQPGDKIYLFGFSRGSYTARVLAAMIYNFGLLRPEAENLAVYLWQSMAEVGTIGAFKHTANRIKRDFCRPGVPIEFMGLFDTVSSVGMLRRFITYPNTDFNPAVQSTCHAVSIDEERNVFPECLMHPGQQGLTEIWFPGVHRDCGGGGAPEMSTISNAALRWIVSEAQVSGLPIELTVQDVNPTPTPNYPTYDPYAVLGLYPMRIFTKEVSAYRTFWPNYSNRRTIPEGSIVHELAVQMREGNEYRPVNWPDHYQAYHPGQPVPTAPNPYVLKPLKPTLMSFVGISIGAAVCTVLWNWIAGAPFGEAWPLWIGAPGSPCVAFDVSRSKLITNCSLTLSSWWISLILGILFLAGQSLGQARVDRWPIWARPRFGLIPSIVGSMAVALAWLLFPGWVPFWTGLGVGVLFSVLALVLRQPILRTIRTMAYVAGGLASAAISLGLFNRLGGGLDDWFRTDALIVFGYWLLWSAGAVFSDRQLMGRVARQEHHKSKSPASIVPPAILVKWGSCGVLMSFMWIVECAAERGFVAVAGFIGLFFAFVAANGFLQWRKPT